MDDYQKVILAAVGLAIAYTLYNAYQTPENGEDDQESGLTYTLDTEGPGYVDLYVSGDRKGQYSNEKKVFSDIPEGSMISLDLLPQEGSRVVSASNKSFSFTTSTTSEIVFESTGAGTGNPFGLTDEQFLVCNPQVRDYLKNPSERLGKPWKVIRKKAVFGFEGLFNDAALAYDGKTNEEYAQDIADILKIGAPSPIINVHVMNNTIFNAPTKTKQQIISKVDVSEV